MNNHGPARPDQQCAATLTLAEAFADDPLLALVSPDPERRAKIGPGFLAVPLAYGMRYGRVWANADASAVAVWLHPESGPMSARRMTESFHKSVEGPHWYLMTAGVRTARQGQGLGSKLVEMGTSRADEAGVPCYLETATDANIAFYRKRGFEFIGQGDCFGYTLTGMIRQPR